MKPKEQPNHEQKKGYLASARRSDLFDANIGFEPKTDWEKIATKIGIVVSVVTVLGFFIGCVTFLYTLQKDTHDYYEQQLNKMVELTNRQAQTEAKVETMENAINQARNNEQITSQTQLNK